MDVLSVLAVIFAIVGVLGSVVPGLPGPPLSFLSLVLLYFSDKADPVSGAVLIWSGVAVAIVTVVDYVLPMKLTSVMGGHKAASVGSAVGLVVGMIIPPVGMILGSILGAFIGEFLFENSGAWESFRASIGAFIGFIVTTFLKVAVASILLVMVFKFAF